jgi:hypothetical protein
MQMKGRERAVPSNVRALERPTENPYTRRSQIGVVAAVKCLASES